MSRAIIEYNLWRQRAAPFSESLAERVSELRRVPYPGCGFHYSMEERAVKATHLLASPWPETRKGIAGAIIAKIAIESLAEAVAAAEKWTEE